MQRTFDLVIPLGNTSIWQDNELRYALRSIEKYTSMIDRVFIVGLCPEWITNIVHIGFPDMHPRQSLRDLNILEKILEACDDERISEDFIFSNDDIILLEPMNELPNYYWGTVREYLEINPYLNAGYKTTMMRTKNFLNTHNLTDKFFDIHAPIIYNKTKFKEIFDENRLAVGIKSIYGNSVIGDDVPLLDCKIKKPYNREQLEIKNQNKPFLSFSDKALTDGMKEYIHKILPTKSKYEK